MDYKYIDQLLERYWAAETTLEEEEILRAFFSQIDIPAELEQFRPLFVYGQVSRKTDVLGEDFDERVLAMIEEPVRVKARRVSPGQRLMPLFRAAAVVAIVLTLGNAAQVPYERQGGEANIAETESATSIDGSAVAMKGDSAVIDTTQQSSQLIQSNKVTE